MVETIEVLKNILNEKIPFNKRDPYNNVINIPLLIAYRLISENILEPIYVNKEAAKKNLRDVLTVTEFTKTIRQEYSRESRYDNSISLAVKWGNIISDIEKTYNIRIDRKKIGLYKNNPPICECGGKCILMTVSKRGREEIRWICPDCGASIGVHKGTDIPLGVPAMTETGRKRILVHNEISRIEKIGMSRRHIYKFLQKQMGLNEEQTHAGLFSSEECDRAIDILKNIKGKINLR